MNIYEKLQKSRVDLQSMDIKKSGKNKFAGFEYFELEDIVPKINKIFLENKLSSFTNFEEGKAILTIVNSEKPEETITFSTRLAEATLKGCHPIQNEGAVITYSRRYLYMIALEVTDKDVLDKGVQDTNNSLKNNFNNKKGTNLPKYNKNDTISEIQLKMLFSITKKMNVTNEEAVKILNKYNYTSTKEVKKEDFDKIIQDIQDLGAAKNGK